MNSFIKEMTVPFIIICVAAIFIGLIVLVDHADWEGARQSIKALLATKAKDFDFSHVFLLVVIHAFWTRKGE